MGDLQSKAKKSSDQPLSVYEKPGEEIFLKNID